MMDTPLLLCKNCADDEEITSYAELEEASDESIEEEKCALCENSLVDSYYLVQSVKISEEMAEDISSTIYGCSMSGCASQWDSEEKSAINDTTNNELSDAIVLYISDLDDNLYQQLLKKLVNEGEWDFVEFEGIHCGGCGVEIDDLFADVKTKAIYRMLPKPPSLPAEVTSVLSKSNPELIEYYRSDSSNYLIHLTKPNELETHFDNVTYEGHKEELSAAEILWLIIKEHRIKAFKGKGMIEPAVCFTDKPLTAIKDTLIGHEANIRKKTGVIQWRCYGLMFPKSYLNGFSVRPTFHLAPKEYSFVPSELRHLIVPYNNKSQWLHEREWRCKDDISFDPAEAIILLPIFDHIEPFRAALAKDGITVRGFLPLLDIFACC